MTLSRLLLKLLRKMDFSKVRKTYSLQKIKVKFRNQRPWKKTQGVVTPSMSKESDSLHWSVHFAQCRFGWMADVRWQVSFNPCALSSNLDASNTRLAYTVSGLGGINALEGTMKYGFLRLRRNNVKRHEFFYSVLCECMHLSMYVFNMHSYAISALLFAR